jgi:tetratricopeptide (TPR) repeat protein
MSQPMARAALSSVEFVAESLPLERPGEIAVALRCARQTLDAARAGGEPPAIAEALVSLARVRFRLGQYGTAAALAEEALALVAPDAPVRADAWQVLGNCAAETGTLSDAETFYRCAADLAREIGYRRAHAAALHGLAAGVYLTRGQFTLALAADEEARAVAITQNRRDWIVYPLVTISMICQLTAQRERAQAALDELGPLIRADSIVQGYRLCTGAGLALDEGELETARVLYTQARSIAEASGEPWLNVSVRLGMSRQCRLAEDGPTARTWADDALAFASRVGYRHEQGKALIERRRAAWLCGNEPDAEGDLRAATQILADLGAAFDLARARLLLAALLHQHSRAEAAAAWLDAARAIIEGGYAFLLEQERALAFPLLSAYQNRPDLALARSCTTLLEHLRRVPPPALQIVTLGRFEVWQGSHCVPK